MDLKILIAGLGNILMKDDGIGVYLCRHLEQYKMKGVEIKEFGVEDWKLACVASDYRDIVIVDAIDMDYEPGQCIVCEDVDFIAGSSVSMHYKGFISELSLIRITKKQPERIFLFGVQIEKIGWGTGLTPLLEKRFCFIAESLRNFIEFLVKGEIYALH